MSDFYLNKLKKHCKGVFLSEKIKQEVANLLDRDDLFEKGLCIRKISGKRETWRISTSEETYYLKIFWNNIIRKIGFLLGLSKAKKELLTAQSLKNKGILVPEIVAYIVEKGKIFTQKEWLITREIKAGQTLKEFVLNDFHNLHRKKQKKIIADFSIYIRKLHDIGVIHSDPNLGNFLIKQDGGKNYFYLLDLADVNIKSSLSLKERWNNLSLLNLSFFRRMPKSLRYYFLKNYSKGLFHKKTNIIEAINIIETQTLNIAKKTLAKRIKWRLENNNFFVAFKKGNLKVHMKKDWSDNRGIEQVLSSPDVFLDNWKGIIFKDGRTVKAARIDTGVGKSLFLKRYNNKGFFYAFKNIFRSSRAKRVWLRGYGFELRGIPIASPVAYMEERRFRILKRSYVVSEFITDAMTLSSIFRSFAKNHREQTMAIMEIAGSEIGKMHRLGCIHGDMKWSNILIKEIDGKYNCFFVDLDSSRIKRRLSLSEIIDELSRFYVEMLKYKLANEEQEVFLKSYYKHCGLEIPYKRVVSKAKEKAIKMSINL